MKPQEVILLSEKQILEALKNAKNCKTVSRDLGIEYKYLITIKNGKRRMGLDIFLKLNGYFGGNEKKV